MAASGGHVMLRKAGHNMGKITLHHLMQTYGEQVGLPVEKWEFHCLKHSIATHLLDAGGDLAFVKDWLGHANIQNSTIYARHSNARCPGAEGVYES